MSDENKGIERVTFSRGYDVCIMAIDGTWRRDCQLNAISDNDAILTLEGSIQGLNPAAVVDGPRLSPMRARSRQRLGDGYPVSQGQKQEEETRLIQSRRHAGCLRPRRTTGWSMIRKSSASNHDPMGRSRLCLSQQTRKRVRA
jgi:hypothetical protein